MASSDIKYPPEVAAKFFSREEESRRASAELFGGATENSRDPSAESLTQAVLTQLVETMLFASMATEEGHLTPVAIVYAESIEPFQAVAPIAPAWDFVQFASSWKFDVNSIAKLASASGSLDSFLVVVPQGGMALYASSS
jgi:hypothetical protein